MKIPMKPLELVATLDEEGQLRLDAPLTTINPGRVRLLILPVGVDDIGEDQWMHYLAKNMLFDYLSDPAEDIYTLEDGIPIDYEG